MLKQTGETVRGTHYVLIKSNPIGDKWDTKETKDNNWTKINWE